jgi:hypothetical protein
MMSQSDGDRMIERAAQLSLLDAAYLLWKQKRQLDRIEASPPPAVPHRAVLRGESFVRSAREAIAAMRHERANAHEGLTFDRMKRAHPEAGDDDLKLAIKAAVKFDQDCTRHFSYSGPGPDYASEVARAVDLAMRENPGFSEETRNAARHALAAEMR